MHDPPTRRHGDKHEAFRHQSLTAETCAIDDVTVVIFKNQQVPAE
jgi:hypothetical protein